MVWNSALPRTMNDGALWAGRGWNGMLMTGARYDRKWITVVAAPELTWSRNLGFPVIASPFRGRSAYSSPFHGLPYSADDPMRFGNRAFAVVGAGQSSIELRGHGVGIGASTQNYWWGPGVRNAIVMSNNAPGIPHLFVRSSRPIPTRIGGVELLYMLGGLTKSRFFDDVDGDGLRSINGGVVSLRTSFDSGLTLGAARAVYAPVANTGHVAGHVGDVFWRWNQSRSLTSAPKDSADQVLSFFFRWAIPGAGLETYAEWARVAPLRNFGDLFVQTSRSQGYTVGLRWVADVARRSGVRVSAEATNLEQSLTPQGVAAQSFYTSRVVPEGYTQRGQVIGASIGPGSSAQWIGVDWIAATREIGVEVGRIRRDDDAYFRDPLTIYSYRHHDVEMSAGLRMTDRWFGLRGTADLLWANRHNYLFQSHDLVDYSAAFDIRNVTLRITITPDP